jgi:hypothetical protein
MCVCAAASTASECVQVQEACRPISKEICGRSTPLDFSLSLSGALFGGAHIIVGHAA